MAGAAEKQTQASISARIGPRDIRPRIACRTRSAIGRMRITSGKLQVTLLIKGSAVTARANSTPDRDAREVIRHTMASNTSTAGQSIRRPHQPALPPAFAVLGSQILAATPANDWFSR